MSKISVMSGIMPLMETFSSAAHEGGIEVAGHSLIDPRGIEEAVAKHDLAPLDRRPDHLLDMVRAGGGEQHRLHSGPNGSAAPDRITWRTASAPGEPPGSRVTTMS